MARNVQGSVPPAHHGTVNFRLLLNHVGAEIVHQLNLSSGGGRAVDGLQHSQV